MTRVNTPHGTGKLYKIKDETILVEIDYSHLVEFPIGECELIGETIEFKPTKKDKSKIITCALISFAVGFTPFAMLLAWLERGYFTIGGEIFLGLFPLAIWALWRNLKDDLKELFRR
jgi:hypothetical protein